MQCRNCNRTFNFITRQLLYNEASGLCRSCAAIQAERDAVI